MKVLRLAPELARHGVGVPDAQLVVGALVLVQLEALGAREALTDRVPRVHGRGLAVLVTVLVTVIVVAIEGLVAAVAGERLEDAGVGASWVGQPARAGAVLSDSVAARVG